MGWKGREGDRLISVVISRDAALGKRLVTAMATIGTAELVDDDRQVALIGRVTTPQVALWHVPTMTIDDLDPLIPVLGVGPNDSEQMLSALEAGAQGYVDVNLSPDEIKAAARQVASGVATVSPLLLGPLLRAVVERRRQEREMRSALEALTPREREVFDLAAQGLSKTAVARALVISTDTARTHLQRVMAKLDLHSQAELVAFAAGCGYDIGRGGRPAP